MATEEELALAKTGIEQLGETGREMVRLAAGSSTASEAGGLLADELRFQRFKRQLKIIRKAEKLVDDAGVSPKAVPLKVLAPLIAWGSLEDDEDMVARWASLLASASCGAAGFHVIYPELLRQLEAREARMIDSLFVLEKGGEPVNRQEWKLKSGAWRTLDELFRHMDHLDTPYVEVDVRNLQNLARLALCLVRNDSQNDVHFVARMSRPGYESESQDGPEIRLTTLGLEFSLACQPLKNLELASAPGV